MRRATLNVVTVSGGSDVDLARFTQVLTESYLPKLEVSRKNGCTLTKTSLNQSYINSNGDIFDSEKVTTDNSDHERTNEIEIDFWDLYPKANLWSRLKAL